MLMWAWLFEFLNASTLFSQQGNELSDATALERQILIVLTAASSSYSTTSANTSTWCCQPCLVDVEKGFPEQWKTKNLHCQHMSGKRMLTFNFLDLKMQWNRYIHIGISRTMGKGCKMRHRWKWCGIISYLLAGDAVASWMYRIFSKFCRAEWQMNDFPLHIF